MLRVESALLIALVQYRPNWAITPLHLPFTSSVTRDTGLYRPFLPFPFGKHSCYWATSPFHPLSLWVKLALWGYVAPCFSPHIGLYRPHNPYGAMSPPVPHHILGYLALITFTGYVALLPGHVRSHYSFGA
jgi:hypothetical protein